MHLPARPILKFFLWLSGIILLSMAATIAPLHSESFAPHAGGFLGQTLVAPIGGWLELLLGDTLTSLSGSITLWLWASAASLGLAGFALALMSAGWFGLFIKTTLYIFATIFRFMRSLLTNKKPDTSEEAESAFAPILEFFRNFISSAGERLRGLGLIFKTQNTQTVASTGP
jgi:hypothetical protein